MEKFIQKIIQFKIESKIFIQIGKIISAWENSEKHAKWAVFSSKWSFYSFCYEYHTFFIHSKIHSIVRQKYSFKEFIHSILRQNIHSKNLFIQKIIWLFIQWKYSFFWKMPYRPPLIQGDVWGPFPGSGMAIGGRQNGSKRP